MSHETNTENTNLEKEEVFVEKNDNAEEVGNVSELESQHEDQNSLNEQIRELEEEIKETNFQHERISRFQSAYSVPDEALTDLDKAVKDVQVSKLEEKLDALKNQKVHQIPKWRQNLRKIAAFFSF